MIDFYVAHQLNWDNWYFITISMYSEKGGIINWKTTKNENDRKYKNIIINCLNRRVEPTQKYSMTFYDWNVFWTSEKIHGYWLVLRKRNSLKQNKNDESWLRFQSRRVISKYMEMPYLLICIIIRSANNKTNNKKN